MRPGVPKELVSVLRRLRDESLMVFILTGVLHILGGLLSRDLIVFFIKANN
jgi:hypothetical protein